MIDVVYDGSLAANERHPIHMEGFSAFIRMQELGFTKHLCMDRITNPTWLGENYKKKEGVCYTEPISAALPSAIIIHCDSNSGALTFWRDDVDTANFFEKVVPDLTFVALPEKRGTRVRVTILSLDSDGDLESNDIWFDSDDHDIDPDLYPDILPEELFKYYMESNESVLELGGEPGTGKTTLVKQFMCSIQTHVEEEEAQALQDEGDKRSIEDILSDVDCTARVAYIKDPAVVKKHAFWNYLLRVDFDLVILDDLDFALSPRERGRGNKFMNQLLSYSDGIFAVETKIIITTNLSIDKIDPALLRSGRCCDILTIKALPKAYAEDLWKKELPDWGYPFEGDTVLQSDFMGALNRAKSDKSLERPYFRSGPRTYSVAERLKEDAK